MQKKTYSWPPPNLQTLPLVLDGMDIAKFGQDYDARQKNWLSGVRKGIFYLVLSAKQTNYGSEESWFWLQMIFSISA